MIFNWAIIVASLVKMGVNLTDNQMKLLKWRTSPEGLKYYTKKENVDFYKAVTKGNIKIVDAIRKEKQKKINKLKTELLAICVISLFCFSCNSIYPKEKIIKQDWNTDSLRDVDRSYLIDDKHPIKIQEESQPVQFKGQWFLVHSDFIKTHNENQDTLFETLNILKSERNSAAKKQTYTIIGIIILCIIMFIVKRK